MERYSEPTHTIPQSLPGILKPLTQVNYILGTFPYSIESENGKIVLSSKSVHFIRALFTLFLICFVTLATIYRAFDIFTSSRDINSDGEPTPIMGPLIEQVCAFYANYITLVILGSTFFKRKRLQAFFRGMENYGESVKAYIDPIAVMRTVRRLLILYGFLALISAVVVSARYYFKPQVGPISVLFELLNIEKDVGPEMTSILSGIFIFYIALAKFACLGYVEIVCCGLATCFSRSMENIMDHLEAQMSTWKSQLKGVKSQAIDKDEFLNLLSSSPGRESVSSNSPKLKLQSELENYIDQIRELNPGLISDSVSGSPNIASHYSSRSRDLLRLTPGKILSHAARKFTSLASMQDVTNVVFGHTLAVNVGCIVGMNVILKYLVIKSFVTDLKVPTNTSVPVPRYSETSDFFNNSNLLDIDPDTITYGMNSSGNGTDGDVDITGFVPQSKNQYGLGRWEWLMFLGLDISMFVRLCVVVISLGKVHKTSLRFNSVMGNVFLSANNVIDELAETLKADGYINRNDLNEMITTMMSPTQASSIVAFMNLYNANPVAFAAGGLFVFSSGLLLMIISIIVSYLVFLLQA